MRDDESLRWICLNCNHVNDALDKLQCAGCGIDWLADDAPEIEDDLEEDCGMMQDGQCTKAGSEFCDWDCPRDRPRHRPRPPAPTTDNGERG